MKVDTFIRLMGRLEDYKEFLDTYNIQYGTKTVVLYQFGKFHEIYGVDNGKEKIGNVTEIANLLGIKETRVSTAILENSRSNPQMAGFNSVNLDERVDKLVDHGYTVVVVNQVPGTKPIKREVAYIQSPSTSTSSSFVNTDPYLVSIYMDSALNRSTGRQYSYIGMSAIDTTTGNSYFYEAASSPADPTLAEDNLTRFIQSFNPVELALNTSQKAETMDNREQVHKWGFRLKDEIGSSLCPTVYTNTYTGLIKGIAYQEEFLGKYFPDRGHLDPLEFLGMTCYDAARLSYMYLLDFCSKHNTRLLIGLSPPKLWNNNNNMILDTSSIIQLNIIESYYNQQKQRSVISMLSKYTRTQMGRRVLRNRVLNPITGIETLNERYQKIKLAANYTDIHTEFSYIRDIDRLYRRMALGSMTPMELYILNSSLDVAYEVLHHTQELSTANCDHIRNIQGAYLDIVDIEQAGKCSITENMQDSIFKLGYNEEIDEISEKIRLATKIREVLCEQLSTLIAPGSTYCKYKEDQKGDSCYCVVTKAQFKKLQGNFPETGLDFIVHGSSTSYHIAWSDFHIDTRNKSNVKFELPLLNQLLREQQKNIQTLRQYSIKLYLELLNSLCHSIGPQLQEISRCIAEVDLYLGMAMAADDNCYCCPEIIPEKDNMGSSLDAVRLRHPLIERERSYVPQSIQLGNQHQQTGMLLYGVNQTGKSCTMKSVGIAIIMAQAGLFVPAERFTYTPYNLLTTRILGNDNISRGLSTFAVEMIELRSILTRCTKYSLNLGDEVCHGTESASAVALVAASIRHMSNMNACFIFATHLHELSKMQEVKELGNVKHYHLTIDFKDDEIIYNRIMKPGSGLGLYGIEVAKHLRLPALVLEEAYKIRNKYFSNLEQPSLDDLKSSHYNTNVVRSVCRVPECKARATQTHHIRHQAAGQSIDGMHKNNKDNLVPICNYHHDMTHGHGNSETVLVIFGYKPNGELDCTTRKKIQSLL